MKTFSIKPANIRKNWVVVDADGRTLGRLCSEIASILRGKHKTSFVPHLDCGDNVIVINAEKIKLTGTKWKDKLYYRHTGYIGGLKYCTAEELRDKHPDRLISHAVKGMLPRNKLSSKILKNLRIYAGNEHPHSGLKPMAMPSRLVRGDKE